ncbi:MAG: phosphoribosylformylglycinamidine cyclo-ligase [Desulfurococcaceae archaeon]
MKYSDAGVNLDVHRLMHRVARDTATRLSELTGIRIKNMEGYAPSINFGNVELNIHVDGVGTKTLVLLKTGKMRTAGWDCVAMNANDVACDGFKILALSDYIALESSNLALFEEVMKGIEEALVQIKAPLLSGETAIMPGLVKGIDVVCITLSYREKERANRAESGDVALGVSSSGLHANGYSLVRKIVEERLGGDYTAVVNGINLGEELSKPTALYYNLVHELREKGLITAAVHITGGGWSKLKRVLGETLDFELEPPEPPSIFKLLIESGDVPVSEAYRVFNMGIGLVLFTKPHTLQTVAGIVEGHGFEPHVLGTVKPGSGRIAIKPSWARGEIVEF